MTVDELLALAQQYISYADRAANRDRVEWDRISANAAIAQAAAQTAQAMILHSLTTSTEMDAQSHIESLRPALRVFN